MAVQAATNGKKTRGDGPVSFVFIDGSNKEHKRVADGASQVKVLAKGGKTKTYNVSTLAPAVIMQLATMEFKKRLDIKIRNTVKDDANAEVIAIADEDYAALKEGKLFSRKEGGAGGPGRTFNFDMWVTIAKYASDIIAKADKTGKRKPASDKQLADFRGKLEAMTPKDRTAQLKKFREKPVYALAEAQYKTEQAKKAIAAGDVDDMDALF